MSRFLLLKLPSLAFARSIEFVFFSISTYIRTRRMWILRTP